MSFNFCCNINVFIVLAPMLTAHAIERYFLDNFRCFNFVSFRYDCDYYCYFFFISITEWKR